MREVFPEAHGFAWRYVAIGDTPPGEGPGREGGQGRAGGSWGAAPGVV